MFELKKVENLKKAGIRAIIYGVDKIGKTTLCLTTPKPVVVQAERGVITTKHGANILSTGYIGSYDAFIEAITGIIDLAANGKLEADTVVIDSITAVERFLHEQIVSKDKNDNATMVTAMGGYAKAYDLATQKAENLIALLDILAIKHGINVVLTAHSMTFKATDSLLGEVWKTDIMLHSPKNDKVYGKRELFSQWADVIANIRNLPEGMQENGQPVTGRLLVVVPSENITAGNRYGIKNNILLPDNNEDYAGWNYLAQEIYTSSGLDYFAR
jgi:hypothetical protein